LHLQDQALDQMRGYALNPRTSEVEMLLCNMLQGFVIRITLKRQITRVNIGVKMKIKTAKNSPYPIEVVNGQTYYWCSCGLSENQPFCDRSHQSTEMTPLEFVATENKTIYFCGCKQSANAPLCDGTHTTL